MGLEIITLLLFILLLMQEVVIKRLKRKIIELQNPELVVEKKKTSLLSKIKERIKW